MRPSSLTLVHSGVGLGPRHTDVRSSVAMCRRVRCTAARRRGDFAEVRSLLAEEIVCHEPGDADHRGAADVLALIKKVSEIPLALGAARGSRHLRARGSTDALVGGTGRHSCGRERGRGVPIRGRQDRRSVALVRRLRPGRHDLVFSFDQRSSE